MTIGRGRRFLFHWVMTSHVFRSGLRKMFLISTCNKCVEVSVEVKVRTENFRRIDENDVNTIYKLQM